MTKQLFARPNKETGDILILNGDVTVARLVGLGPGEWIFDPLCPLAEWMENSLDLTGLVTLSAYLRELRRAYDAVTEAQEQYDAPISNEESVLPYPFDPEAQADLERHCAAFPHGYR